MTPKTTAFGKFIHDMEKESGKTGDELRAILRGAGHKTFELDKTHLYRSAIASFCLAKEEARAKKFKTSDLCPVQNCTGYKDRSNRYWPWTCTIGGIRHYLVENISYRTGIPHQELLRRIEDVVHTKKQEEEEALKQYAAARAGKITTAD